jgi:hypothetical protein
MSCLNGNGPHEFIDMYDEVKTIPESIIDLASNCSDANGIAAILSVGKESKHIYVMSYCQHCGHLIKRACTE